MPTETQPQFPPLAVDNDAVLKHIEMYQGMITRMAQNSSASKHWCIILVSAFLAFVIKDGKADLAWLVAIPILIFWFLDAYYLGLEKQFRDAFNVSMNKLRSNRFTAEDLFQVKTDGTIPNHILLGFTSWATWPVYLGLLILMTLARAFV